MYYVIEMMFENGVKITKSFIAMSGWGAMDLARARYWQAIDYRLIGSHGA